MKEEPFNEFNESEVNKLKLEYIGEQIPETKDHYAYTGVQVCGSEYLYKTTIPEHMYEPTYWETQTEKIVYFHWFPVGVDLPTPKF